MEVKGFIAKKIGMSRVADTSGSIIPVTLLQIENQQVTKILTQDKDSYSAYQVGFTAKREGRLTLADKGRLQKVGIKDCFSKFKEFRTPSSVEAQLGQSLTIAHLEGIKAVDITGIVKGRGFQGAVKRWGASIGRMTHGSRFHRRPGSLGQCSSPGRVFKNKHQPGQMGSNRCTVRNLEVVSINKEENIIAVKGSIPGASSSLVTIRATNKKK